MPKKPRPPPMSIDLVDDDSGKQGDRRSGKLAMDLEPVRRALDGMEIDAQEKASVEAFLIKKSRFVEFQSLELSDFEKIRALGHGHGGSVFKVLHKPTQLILAEKTIRLEVKKEVRERILRELRVLHRCSSPHIVGFFGSFWHEGEIHILMEYMDGGSLDVVLRRVGRIPENVIAVICSKVVEGLLYLHNELSVMHRDIKPSNILVNSDGAVKLCDFGVSGELQGSLAYSFVGTRSYMAPERLKGQKYTVTSDVWSLGLSLIELATGHFPIPPERAKELVPIREPPATVEDIPPPPQEGGMVVFELLTRIVEGEPPHLPDGAGFSPEFCSFVEACTRKAPEERPKLTDLAQHPFIADKAKLEAVDMAAWVKGTMVRAVLEERLAERERFTPLPPTST
ncbi:STE/STE7/MEK1 protein kinase [Salpingoeca rosetta]|uniref:STE/STE7/MEK1 protein kinase n=1 Tax=Salpingoeca rosetta (strain ATCC 50818 / BSB-021) TaxID=946362 RepID=F2U7S5_SALR5|nr:STE/STE7/MEK1 protein kinase [Salpingoeca rosetta]EGD72830.1 STE/STE7/MEK1 protein kinase [Salpingoeca rosetta]|eukprot:XP_004994653.1 STE/STE7/MEK1 protein kinase [Salpingoeca rosetta]